MTDNDIIKALECCIKISHFGECFENKCPLVSENGCSGWTDDKLLKDALDLINRQKAEIERLQKYNTDIEFKHYNDGRAEAITEFAERMKTLVSGMVDAMWNGDMVKCRVNGCRKPSHIPCGSEICIEENKTLWTTDIDQIAKELKGEQ